MLCIVCGVCVALAAPQCLPFPSLLYTSSLPRVVDRSRRSHPHGRTLLPEETLLPEVEQYAAVRCAISGRSYHQCPGRSLSAWPRNFVTPRRPRRPVAVAVAASAFKIGNRP